MTHKEHGHHHDKNSNTNNNTTILQSIIIVLLIVIAIGTFYLGQTLSKQNIVVESNISPVVENNTTPITPDNTTKLEVKVYDDVRCLSCNTEELLGRLS